MKPFAKQAPPEAGGNITLATKAKQVEAWLAALPHGDIPASAYLLAEYLRAHDSPEVPSGLRGQMLNLVAAALRRIVNGLTAEFRDLPLPMDSSQLVRAELALKLLGAAADFTRSQIADSTGRSPPLFGENPLPGHLGRFLHLQREIMALCHLCHRQLPAGFWLDTHQTGLMMFRTGLVGQRDPADTGTTLGEPYLAMLLEATADPYHLPEQERIWALDIIARLGGLAVLTTAQGASQGGVFGIRAGQDKPPYPLSWQQDTTPDCDLVLNTAPLVRKLALIIGQMEQDRLAVPGLPAVRHPGYKDLLLRLKLTWGGSSQRTMARHRPAKPSPRQAVIGFHPVYRHLAQPGGQPGNGPAVSCQLVNECLGGLALLVAKPNFRLKIGTLVWVGRGQGEVGDLGLVRWFKSGGNGALTFGVKFLHGRPRPVLWSRPEDGQLYPGLLTEPEKGQPTALRSLVVPPSRLDPQGKLELREDGQHAVLQLDGRLEAQPEAEVFRCAAAKG